MSSHLKIIVPKNDLIELCKKNHIQKLAFFGSVLRDDFRPDSDVDILVEFEKGHGPGFLGLSHIAGELSNLVGGRQVDLRTPKELSRYFRDDVLASAEIQFAQG